MFLLLLREVPRGIEAVRIACQSQEFTGAIRERERCRGSRSGSPKLGLPTSARTRIVALKKNRRNVNATFG
jgi:hypothetical protein